MKTAFAGLAVCGLMLFTASPAFSCYEWASYGTFNLGSWGDNNNVVDAGTVGSDAKVRSNNQWDSDGSHYISSCSYNAEFHSMAAIGQWPEQRRKIQIYFQDTGNKCVAYFRQTHNQYASKLCQ